MTLGVDWAAEMAATFTDDFRDASFTHVVTSTRDAHDLTGGPTVTTEAHACKVLALGYARRLIDGATIKSGDFRVIILRASIKSALQAPEDPEDPVIEVHPSAVPAPGDTITCVDPNGAAVTARVVALDAITLAFVTAQVRGAGL